MMRKLDLKDWIIKMYLIMLGLEKGIKEINK